MKRIIKITLFLLIGTVLVSCNQKQLQQQEEEIARLTQEKEILEQTAQEQEQNLNEFFESMGKIRENLTEIKLRQNLISEETRDKDNLGEDVRGQIESDLAAINDLMEDNRRRLAQLNRQLKESNVKIGEFENLVTQLKKDVEDRNVEIALLQDNMEQLNIRNEELNASVDQLEEENQQNLQEIEQKTERMNTAYYVFGTKNELRESEIIDLEGGLLGLGRTTVVKSDLDTEKFNRVDISQLDKVYIPGENPNLLSLHPADSYVVETNGDGNSMIFIQDPDQFWSNTRYLVVTIE